MLVGYSDSSSDEETRVNSQLVERPFSKLPLPAFANDKSNSASTDIDEQGKVRSFAHETGCWASYIYIDVACRSDWEELADSLCLLVSQTSDVKCYPIDSPHVSLSRTLKLRHHWLNELKRDLHEMFNPKSRFLLGFNDVHIYTNDEKTRTFISVKVSVGITELKLLVSEIDNTILPYDQPVFYEDPSFHVSLCWCAGDQSSLLKPLLTRAQNAVDDEFHDNPGMKTFLVEKIFFKSGNKLFEFPLAVK